MTVLCAPSVSLFEQSMQSLVVNLVIAADEYLRVYAGSARQVSTISVDGRRVSFPANILRQFVTRDGIRGRFLIQFDNDNRFHSVRKLD